MPSMEIEKYSSSEIDDLSYTARNYAVSNGLVFLNNDEKSSEATTLTQIPVTLFPTVIPREAFVEALSVQQAYNKLYAKVSNDHRFLERCLKDMCGQDEFISKLWKVYEESRAHFATLKKPCQQPVSLGIFRSDYLVTDSKEGPSCKQVEFNTISVSFGAASKVVKNMHNYLSDYGLYHDRLTPNHLTINTSTTGIVMGLNKAYCVYKQQAEQLLKEQNNELPDKTAAQVIVLFIVDRNERNIMDQCALEIELNNRFKVPSARIYFDELDKSATLDNKTNKLFVKVKGKVYEVAVAYYRTAYALSEYTSEADWNARLTVEKSLAIKCPSIAFHLAGSKKIQQELAVEGVLENYLSGNELKAIRYTFADMYPLDESEAGLKGRKLALESPEHYVLKPQREGGGNNVYGADIPKFLEKTEKKNWSSYILMRHIDAIPSTNYILKGKKAVKFETVDELGILGTLVYNSKTGEELQNTQVGYICRTKPINVSEGGVATGYASLSSVHLLD
ncbi:glutathione synthetase large subunit G [Schizosaccharomyces japonicus yFS275]|uniref:Glutathione synthetase n=1 Tax=Schizosaccharomyces japonicus (strain yFS275 / FY16936) TaxID=402676 RepID=B6K0F8_SCHJY|nr:glutathione synthetase large subunit G [Schizosaccharomyces japonicus yFS275]EEB06308.2 glutathione synthetase large subunit G [Schizosaccharomyces japonicus yFS275]